MSKGVMYVDNIRVEYDNEPNVLEVCRKAGVEIPNFCFHSDLSVYGACRMCMVEEEGTGKIDAACTMPPKNELHIRTNTARLLKYRRMIIELLLSAHCRDCTTCERNRACRLQEMAVRSVCAEFASPIRASTTRSTARRPRCCVTRTSASSAATVCASATRCRASAICALPAAAQACTSPRRTISP